MVLATAIPVSVTRSLGHVREEQVQEHFTTANRFAAAPVNWKRGTGNVAEASVAAAVLLNGRAKPAA